MKALIIEDELPAQTNLRRALEKQFDDIEIVGTQTSVRGAVEWLGDPANRADVIFMDVELSDGMCFDIFEQTRVTAQVIITTAYDNYAVKAFKVNSIDYLLKPIDQHELHNAVERCRRNLSTRSGIDLDALREALRPREREYKRRFVLRIGDKIVLLQTEDIAYFYAEDKCTYAVTDDGRKHMLDISLDAVSESVDPKIFFRLSRNCVASIRSIGNITRHTGSRLKVTLQPKADFEVFVSRIRINEFMNWLDDK